MRDLSNPACSGVENNGAGLGLLCCEQCHYSWCWPLPQQRWVQELLLPAGAEGEQSLKPLSEFGGICTRLGFLTPSLRLHLWRLLDEIF